MSYNQGDGSTPIKFNTRKDTGYSSSNDSTRPVGNPKANKDFKKIYRDRQGDDDDENSAQEVGDAAEGTGLIANRDLKPVKAKRPQSIFDLTTNQAQTKGKAEVTPKSRAAQADILGEVNSEDGVINAAVGENLNVGLEEEVIAPPEENLAKTLIGENAKKTENPKTKATTAHLEASTQANMAVSSDRPLPMTRKEQTGRAESPHKLFSKLSKTDASKMAVREEDIPVIPEVKSNKFTTRFATEQSDLSYVNPMAGITHPIDNVSVKEEPPVTSSPDIQSLITQLVDRAYQLETSGRTETVVVLKHPPVFAGANLVLTGFDSAKGEFNISFENLTQEAKRILDMQVNQESLRVALEQKGYAVHIVTTTTLIERAPIVENPQPGESDRRQRDESQGRGEQGRGRRREEEGF